MATNMKTSVVFPSAGEADDGEEKVGVAMRNIPLPVPPRGGRVTDAGGGRRLSVAKRITRWLGDEDAKDDGDDDKEWIETSELACGLIIFSPLSHRRQVWDFFCIAFVLWNLVMLPIDLAFQVTDGIVAWKVVDVIMDTFFIVDVFINFFTPFRQKAAKHKFVTNNCSVAFNYLKTWFILDFVSSFPFEAVFFLVSLDSSSGNTDDSTNLDVTKTFKIGRLLKNLRILRMARAVKLVGSGFLVRLLSMGRIVKLILMFAVLVHTLGCFFFFFSVFDDDATGTWAWGQGIHPDQTTESSRQYVVSVYSVLAMLLGESIDVRTDAEYLVAMVILSVGAISNAALFGNMALLIANLSRGRTRHQMMVDSCSDHMECLKLDRETCVRVHEFIEYEWALSKSLDRNRFLETLSPVLQSEVCLTLCGYAVRRVSFFRRFEAACVVGLIKKLDTKTFMKTDDITLRDQVARRMFFVNAGQVDYICKMKTVKKVKEGGHFDKFGILNNSWRTTHEARAKTNCSLFILSRNDFIAVIEKFPDTIELLRKALTEETQRDGETPRFTMTTQVQSRQIMVEQTKQSLQTGLQALYSGNKKPSDAVMPSSASKKSDGPAGESSTLDTIVLQLSKMQEGMDQVGARLTSLETQIGARLTSLEEQNGEGGKQHAGTTWCGQNGLPALIVKS